MDNELNEVLGNVIDEIKLLRDVVEKIDQRLEVVEFKVDRNLGKINDLSLEQKIMERNIKKEIRKLSDENEMVIEVLKIHDILPQ